MRVLVDTHTLIWYTTFAENLSLRAKQLIASDQTDVEVSIASLWEMSIKVALGRLEVNGGFEAPPDVLRKFNIEILPVKFTHTLCQSILPFHNKNKDPFERIIAAQAIVEGIDLVSIDDVFDSYFADTEVKRIW